MKSRNFLPGIESNNNALLHYELLRSQVLNKQETVVERRPGLALFIRQGLLAWIDICHRCTPVGPKPLQRSKRFVLSHEITSEMIKVMANITLFNLEEVLS
jgi:hypothetical protein